MPRKIKSGYSADGTMMLKTAVRIVGVKPENVTDRLYNIFVGMIAGNKRKLHMKDLSRKDRSDIIKEIDAMETLLKAVI